MTAHDFGELLSRPLAPPAVPSFHLSTEISKWISKRLLLWLHRVVTACSNASWALLLFLYDHELHPQWKHLFPSGDRIPLFFYPLSLDHFLLDFQPSSSCSDHWFISTNTHTHSHVISSTCRAEEEEPVKVKVFRPVQTRSNFKEQRRRREVWGWWVFSYIYIIHSYDFTVSL